MGESEDDELGWSHGGHADFDDHAAFEDIERRHGLPESDRHIECVFRLDALQRALPAGFRSLRDDALLKAAHGVTSLEEVYVMSGGGELRDN